MKHFLPSKLLKYFDVPSLDIVQPLAKHLSALVYHDDWEQEPLHELVRIVHGDPSNVEHISSQERLRLDTISVKVQTNHGDVDVDDHNLEGLG